MYPFPANWAGQMTSPPITSMSPAPRLELRPELVEVLAGVGGHLPVADLKAAALLVEGFDQLRQDPRVVGPPGEDEFVATIPEAAAAGQGARPQQRGPREPRTARS